MEGFELSAEVLNIDREPVVVDTTYNQTDLSALPVIQADSTNVQVRLAGTKLIG